MPDVSCHQQFGGFRMGIQTKNLLAFSLQQETHSLPEVGQTFLLGLTLPIRSRNLEAGGPLPSLDGLSLMQNRRQLLHARTLAMPWGKRLFAPRNPTPHEPYKMARMG